MSRPRHTCRTAGRAEGRPARRLAVVALTFATAALAACAEGLPTAPRAAAPASRVAADSAAGSARGADSLVLPPACRYAPDSARIDTTGVDPEALAVALACRDSVALQHPFDYPAGDAFALPEGVSLAGAMTGMADEAPPEGAQPVTSANRSPCAGADTIGIVGPASVVVCMTLRNEGKDSARVTVAPGLVLVAEQPGVQNAVVVTRIVVAVAPGAERRVALAAFGAGGWRRLGGPRDTYRFGPVSAHPVVAELVRALAGPAGAALTPEVVQELIWILAEHGNDELTVFVLEMLQHALPPSVKALRAALGSALGSAVGAAAPRP